MAAFIVAAIAVEAATYRVTTLVIHRQRPRVPRLDHLPVNASYYSGHTAASVAVYCGVALLITVADPKRAGAQALCWLVAVAIPLLVALSRMYRGMHHPTDVAAGLLVGIGALVVAVAAARAAKARRGARRGAGHDDRRRDRPRRQEHRGRPARASPHARAARRAPTRCGSRCRRARRRRSRCKRLLRAGADHFFVWGGDGMAQRCIDALAGTGATIAIVPAGTANLLATNLGIPKDIDGRRRRPACTGSRG